MTEEKGDIVLAQNQYAFVQDDTKGLVQVLVGPSKQGLTSNDKPVIFKDGKFVRVSLEAAVAQNPAVSEGSYLVLENPAKEGAKPEKGGNPPIELQVGRKVNIPGPVSFALWPGQTATIVEGHQLRSNEYVVVRVYNVTEARANWPKDSEVKLPEDLEIGQLMIIKGTEISFFIPPTGMEVVKEPTAGKYIRQALTLERLEYCILLDENGNKRYERGPAVVFPEATEKFIQRDLGGDGRVAQKFKAVELNDQMGLYIKVIADYEEEVGIFSADSTIASYKPEAGHVVHDGKVFKTHKVGDELFIKGTEQRIYYPIPEHAVIEYGSEDGKFKRQRYYGIAIPKGEARYVLNKDSGVVAKQNGPKVFLPDPRTEVIVRRVLDDRTVSLWYPGNEEALAYNQSLRETAAETQRDVAVAASANFVQDTTYRSSMDLKRSMNRGTMKSTALAGGGAAMASAGPAFSSASNVQGERLQRGAKYTPPPTLTLDTKYDGVPPISVWTGYAVQVVDKEGNRKVVKGPATILMEYDEFLEVLTLSTGKPKTTETIYQTVYLRVDHNVVSDIVTVETKDMVQAELKLSYRVNFEGAAEKWFAVENYVKYICDHMRSKLRSAIKGKMIKELIDSSADIVRDTVLGVKATETQSEGVRLQRTGASFPENGMKIYDVEVLATEIQDLSIKNILMNAQKETVEQSLALAQSESQVALAEQRAVFEKRLATLAYETDMHELDLDGRLEGAKAKAEMEKVKAAALLTGTKLSDELTFEDSRKNAAALRLTIKMAEDQHRMAILELETENFTKRFAAITPDLVAAIKGMSDTELMSELASAVAPLAIMEQQGVATILTRLVKGTGLEGRLEGMLTTVVSKPGNGAAV